MNYKEIESLKLALLNLSGKGSKISIPAYGISGRIVGVGFKPYWTGPVDSKIEKLEINFIDDSGSVKPFSFQNIIGYTVVSNDGRGYDSMRNTSIDIHVYLPGKGRGEEPVEKIRIDIIAA